MAHACKYYKKGKSKRYNKRYFRCRYDNSIRRIDKMSCRYCGHKNEKLRIRIGKRLEKIISFFTGEV